PAEAFHRRPDDAPCGVPVRDRLRAGDGLAAAGLDLAHDVERRTRRRGASVDGDPVVVHHDLRACRGEGERDATTDPAPGTRDHTDAAGQHVSHAMLLPRVGTYNLPPSADSRDAVTGRSPGCYRPQLHHMTTRRAALREVAAVFATLGCTAFGG